jgi:hypothetical protein
MDKNLNKLPDVAFVDNGWDQSPGAPPVIGIKRGEIGFWPVFTRLAAAELNDGKCTPAQASAMHAGSMFGWDVPAADPDLYDEQGHIVKAKVRGLMAGLR